MGLIADLGDGPVGVDTAVFIYLFEESQRYLPLIEPIFQEASAGGRPLVTSALTLLEVLVVPYRAGDHVLARHYETLLLNSRGIRVVDLDRDILRDAAQLRAVAGLKTPDALQIAACLRTGCSTFVTNDRRIPSISGMRVLQLADYDSEAPELP